MGHKFVLPLFRAIQLHGTYYITKQIIPALARVFDLLGVDIRLWFSEMPRVQRTIKFGQRQKHARMTIDSYYSSGHCAICESACDQGEHVSTFLYFTVTSITNRYLSGMPKATPEVFDGTASTKESCRKKGRPASLCMQIMHLKC